MASLWIKVEHTTPDKPEIVKLASLLNIDQDTAFGKCMRLWIWADQQSQDGDALSVTKKFIDRCVCHNGFAEALLSVGWLRGKDGALTIPKFERHNGDSAKKRALTAERMSRKRDADSVTKSSPDEDEDEDEDEENVLEKNNKKTPLPPTQIPEDLDTEDFRNAWASWVEHRKTIRKKLTPRAMALQLKNLTEMGESRAIIAIEHSIMSGWTGIFEPKSNGNGHEEPSEWDKLEAAAQAKMEADDREWFSKVKMLGVTAKRGNGTITLMHDETGTSHTLYSNDPTTHDPKNMPAEIGSVIAKIMKKGEN